MKVEKMSRLLPAVVQEGITPESPMMALLKVMETLHQPSEKVIETVDSYFNVYQAPDAFIPFLASWVDLDRFFPEGYSDHYSDNPLGTGMGRLRELVSIAAYLSQWRGTRTGLLRFLETATGVEGFVIEEQAESDNGSSGRSFHLSISAPQEAYTYKALIERIIEQEKPAYVTYELMIKKTNPEGQ